jgi:hypothetical protein
MSTSSPPDDVFRRAHPLAAALIERLRSRSHARVLEIGAGRGRNTEALKAAGFSVLSIADDRIDDFAARNAGALIDAVGSFDGALSTHGFLHGGESTIAETIIHAADALRPGAPLYATFASVRDARYGNGIQLAPHTFAPESGDEQGVPHTYFDERALRELLQGFFAIESLREQNVDEIVGAWAHRVRPQGHVHWIAHLRRGGTG